MKKVIVRTPSNDRQLINLMEPSDVVIPTPSVGVIPVGFALVLEFSGKNADNALRHMNWGAGSMGVACPTPETRILIPWAGTLMNLITQLDTAFPNSGGDPTNQCRFTVRKNGVGNNAANDTALEVNWHGPDIGHVYKANLVDSVAVVAGDYIGITYNEVTMGGAMSGGATARFILVKT